MVLANVEALTTENEPFADCPRDKYIRNEKETWKVLQVNYDADFGFYIRIRGMKVKLGADAKVGGTVLYPDCVTSQDNCCEKKHLKQKFRYA